MNQERFQKLLDELDGNSLQTLKEKNARYSQNGDALHNFRSGADIAGGTPAQACWGYLTKHLVALRDMVDKNDFSNREDFLEKCQDTINYIRFLWCIGNDESEENSKEKTDKDDESIGVDIRVYEQLTGSLVRFYHPCTRPEVEVNDELFAIHYTDHNSTFRHTVIYPFSKYYYREDTLKNGEYETVKIVREKENK